MSSIAAECWWSHFYQPFPFFQILRIQWTTFWRNTVKEIDKTASKDNFRGVVTASHPHEIIVAYLWIMRSQVEVMFFKSPTVHSVWKSPKMSHFNFLILVFSTNFYPIKTDLSGNTVWPKASGFQKFAKMDNFWHF